MLLFDNTCNLNTLDRWSHLQRIDPNPFTASDEAKPVLWTKLLKMFWQSCIIDRKKERMKKLIVNIWSTFNSIIYQNCVENVFVSRFSLSTGKNVCMHQPIDQLIN